MTLFHRRLIYSIFIGIFLVSAPLIVLYTMGYRYNFDKGRVQKTGIIRITSTPRGADIYLNGAKYETGQTPARIEKLLPGDYEIKLSKDGYYDWQKKLPVYENGTTFAEKVILWKKSVAMPLATTTAVSWLKAPDGNTIAIIDNQNTAWLLNIDSGLFGEISGGSIDKLVMISGFDNLRLLSFSLSEKYILVEAKKGAKASYLFIDSGAKKMQTLPARDYQTIKWEASTDILYALDKTGLISIEPASLKIKTISKNLAADDFYVANNSLYSISAGVLSKQTLGGKDPETIEKLNCPKCKITDIKSNRLIAMGDDGDLAIVDLNRQIKTIEAKAKRLDWLNSKSLIFYNDYEIFIYDFAKSDPELITRLGSPITSAIWHPNGRDVIFSSGNKLTIIELDNRELRNTISIATTSAPFIASDRAGNNLYYSIDESGIFKLNIQ